MLVSWNWLQDYVALPPDPTALIERLTMAGLNVEEVRAAEQDWVLDLEITSNRADCLGHIGVARELSILLGQPLRIPQITLQESPEAAHDQMRVSIEASDLCSQYHARIIRGVQIAPSPSWMQRRLRALGVASVNNVVDITNYVLLECAQPSHAFDADQLHGRQIVVRRARQGERFRAINQREYVLNEDMCVIADGMRPIAVAGVMGGLETEITVQTKNVLLETAMFHPLSIRTTARKLDLHSPSSYRFERALDPAGPDWASRRCCQLIQELAGGTLLRGSLVAGDWPLRPPEPITLRWQRLEQVLGIVVPLEQARRMLESLGMQRIREDETCSVWIPPTHRPDLTREIDLIEEIARLYGYHHIPDDVTVPISVCLPSRQERVIDYLQDLLSALGFHEAVTLSFVGAEELSWFSARDMSPLQVDHASRRQEPYLRQSLIPSLLLARRLNERRGQLDVALYEIAKVYLQAAPHVPEHESEPWMLGLVRGGHYLDLKGVLEEMVRRLAPQANLEIKPSELPAFTPGRGAELWLDGRRWGWLGELTPSLQHQIDLREPVYMAEVELLPLIDAATFVKRIAPISEYPVVSRDLNFVLQEEQSWRDLEICIKEAAGPYLEQLVFAGQYRGQQLGPNLKSYLVSLSFRAADRTLTTEEVDQMITNIVRAVAERMGARLRGT